MQQQNIHIGTLVDMSKRGELRLPEIQRHYVWQATRVRDLLDSLYRGYPSGSILMWETDEPVPTRDFAIAQETTAFAGRKLLLDGQQRLTSLTAVLGGELVQVRGRKRPIDIRPVRPQNPMAPDVREPVKQVWFRARGPLPDDDKLHRYLLAYASDFHFLVTALHPHGRSWLTPGMQVASLDHAMWFHRPARADQWILYAQESPSAQGGRGLGIGRMFAADGTLVATVAQEGMVRFRDS